MRATAIGAHDAADRRPNPSEHDPEKCVAVFPKGHAQSKTWSAMTLQPALIALQLKRRSLAPV